MSMSLKPKKRQRETESLIGWNGISGMVGIALTFSIKAGT